MLATIRDRCRSSSRKDKSRIFDEFIAVTGRHRKHGIRLLGKPDHHEDTTRSVRGRRIYDEAVREGMIVIGEAADRICEKRRICGKRLRAALPNLAGSMERHGHLALDPEVRERLPGGSAATLDRLLKPTLPLRAAVANASVDSRWAGVFINGTLIKHCADHGIEFIRSRACGVTTGPGSSRRMVRGTPFRRS